MPVLSQEMKMREFLIKQRQALWGLGVILPIVLLILASPASGNVFFFDFATDFLAVDGNVLGSGNTSPVKV